MLAEQGLGGTRAARRARDRRSRTACCPRAALAPVRGWLDALSADARRAASSCAARSPERSTACPPRVDVVLAALGRAGRGRATRCARTPQRAYARRARRGRRDGRSGSLLRGEVLARWHEVVGTGDFMRALESRRRVAARPACARSSPARRAPTPSCRPRCETASTRVVHAAADRAAERAARRWREQARRAARCSSGTARLDAASPGLHDATREEVRALAGPRLRPRAATRAQGKRSTARLASLGVNGAGLDGDDRGVRADGRADRGGDRRRGRHVGGRPAACSRRSSATRPCARSPRAPARTCSPASSGCSPPRPRASTRVLEPRRPRPTARATRSTAPLRGRRARAVSAASTTASRALAEAVELAGGRLDDDAVARPRERRRARRRSGSGSGVEATVVALAGPTGAGKSTLFNALAARSSSRRAAAADDRPTATAAMWGDGRTPLLDWLEVPRRHRVAGDGPSGPRAARPAGLRLGRGRAPARGRAARSSSPTSLVWVVDPQKYADAALHERYLRPLAGHARGDARRPQPGRPLDADALAACRARPRRGCCAADGLERRAGARRVRPRRRRARRAARDARDARARRAAAVARLARRRRRVAAERLAAGVRRRRGRRRSRAPTASALAALGERRRGAGGGAAPSTARTAAAARSPPGWPLLRWAAAAAARPAAPPAPRPDRAGDEDAAHVAPGADAACSARRSARPSRALAARAAEATCPTRGPGLVRDARDRARGRAGRAPGPRRRRRRPARDAAALVGARRLAPDARWRSPRASARCGCVALAGLGYLQLDDAVPTPELEGIPAADGAAAAAVCCWGCCWAV